MDDIKAFDEYFDLATLKSLSKSLKILLGEVADRNAYGQRFSPRELQSTLQAIFLDFDSELCEVNPRQTVVNFIKSGYLQLAYFWNLSRKSSTANAFSEHTLADSHRQVSEWVIHAALYQEVQNVRSELDAIHDRFAELSGFGADL